jgi:hypothetical protein
MPSPLLLLLQLLLNPAAMTVLDHTTLLQQPSPTFLLSTQLPAALLLLLFSCYSHDCAFMERCCSSTLHHTYVPTMLLLHCCRY